MAIYEIIKAIILGIVQGITEWLPISSTGHLILFEDLLKLSFSESFISMFTTVIQLGSIMAVVVLFFNKLNPFSPKKNKEEKKSTINLWLKIIVAIIPIGIIGTLFEDKIDALLYNAITVAIMLIIYGIIFLIIEKKNIKPTITDLAKISFKAALLIGLFQTLALIPGTSRSGATIVGALLLGTSRYVAAEFSFFLAIPTMLGASFIKLLKFGFNYTSLELIVLITGSVVAFLVSLFAIKFLLNYIKNHDFKPFGYYRIILGIIILLLMLL
ncbi:MAG: undecaprenyl-diphosphate phosphatase [Bacilli bacterium]|nr:undecaprenyl-diphosphate phosphatase [Bacilli bacterium]